MGVPAGVEPFSGAEVVAGETFELENALWKLGGAPQVIRSDNSWPSPMR